MNRDKALLVAITALILIAAVVIGYTLIAGAGPLSLKENARDTSTSQAESVGAKTGPERALEAGDTSPHEAPGDTANGTEDGASENADDDPPKIPEIETGGGNTAVFNGKVTDAETGEPLHWATVIVRFHDDTVGVNIHTKPEYGGLYSVEVPAGHEVSLIFTSADYKRFDSLKQFVEAGKAYNLDVKLESTLTCTIAGIVLDAETGEPITDFSTCRTLRYAKGYLSSSSSGTHEGGRFSYRAAPGRHFVTIEKDSYEQFDTPEFALAEGETKEIEVKLIRAAPVQAPVCEGVIEGWITDAATGLPLEGILIGWWCWQLGRPHKGDTATDANGYYKLNVPESEDLQLCIGSSNDDTYLRQNRYEIAVEKGRPLTINFALKTRSEIVIIVSGTVTDASTGKPVMDSRVTLDRFGRLSSTNTDIYGCFELEHELDKDLSSKPCRINVEKIGYRRYARDDMYFIEDKEYSFEISLEPCRTYLEGRAVNADTGAPLAGVVLQVKSQESGYFGFKVVTDDAGRFKIESIGGEHEISCEFEGYEEYWDSVELSEGIANSCEVRLSPLSGLIKVTVLDAKTGGPVGGASIWLIEDYEEDEEGYYLEFSEEYEALADSNGYAQIRTTTGVFTLLVEHDGYVSDSTGRFAVASGLPVELTLRLIPLDASISGRAYDSITGAPIEDCYIEIRRPSESTSYPDFRDNVVYDRDNGTFSMKVPEGEHEITCRAKGYIHFSGIVAVRSGENARVDIPLSRIPDYTAAVWITAVMKSDGLPVEKCFIDLSFVNTHIAHGQTDARGCLSVSVPPGEIKIEAFYYDEDSDAAYRGTATVEIAEGQTKEITLELEIFEDDTDE